MKTDTVSALWFDPCSRFDLCSGIPFCNPRYELWKVDELALLGNLPDEEVARLTAHSLASVRHARFKRRIPGLRPTALDWTPEQEALLGTAPDEEIAARLSRTIIAVGARRRKKGIPAWRAMN